MSTTHLAPAPTGARAPRYRRGPAALATPPSPRRQPARTIVPTEDLSARPDPLELIAPELTGKSVVSERRWRGIAHLSRRVTAVIAASLAAALGVGILTTGAYFTDFTQVNGGTNLGSIRLAVNTPLDSSNAEIPFTVTKLVPLGTSDAADMTKGSLVDFTVKRASIEARGRIEVTPVVSGTTANVLPWVMVQVFNGSTWSTAVPLSTSGSSPVISAALSDEFTLARATSTVTASDGMKVRVFLKSDTPNSLQSATVKFTLGTKSIQQFAPSNTTY